MPDELTTDGRAARSASACATACASPHNWLQLVRFAAVGASGYVVNLGGVRRLRARARDRLPDRRGARLRGLGGQQLLVNRHWTFDAKHEHPILQGARFFAVSLVAFGFTYVVLIALVDGAGMAKVVAQAIAIAAGTPLSFLGQKLWSFRA